MLGLHPTRLLQFNAVTSICYWDIRFVSVFFFWHDQFGFYFHRKRAHAETRDTQRSNKILTITKTYNNRQASSKNKIRVLPLLPRVVSL